MLAVRLLDSCIWVFFVSIFPILLCRTEQASHGCGSGDPCGLSCTSALTRRITYTLQLRLERLKHLLLALCTSSPSIFLRTLSSLRLRYVHFDMAVCTICCLRGMRLPITVNADNVRCTHILSLQKCLHHYDRRPAYLDAVLEEEEEEEERCCTRVARNALAAVCQDPVDPTAAALTLSQKSGARCSSPCTGSLRVTGVITWIRPDAANVTARSDQYRLGWAAHVQVLCYIQFLSYFGWQRFCCLGRSALRTCGVHAPCRDML